MLFFGSTVLHDLAIEWPHFNPNMNNWALKSCYLNWKSATNLICLTNTLFALYFDVSKLINNIILLPLQCCLNQPRVIILLQMTMISTGHKGGFAPEAECFIHVISTVPKCIVHASMESPFIPTVWPDARIKSGPIVTQSGRKSSQSSFYIIRGVFKIAHKYAQ